MKSRSIAEVRSIDLGEELGYEAEYKYLSLGKDHVDENGLTLVLNAGLGAPAFGAPDFNRAHGQELTFDALAPKLLSDQVQRIIVVNRPGTGQADKGTLSTSAATNRSLETIVQENIAFLRALGVGKHATVSHSAGAIVGLATAFGLQPGDPELKGMTKIDPVPVNLDPINTFSTKRILIQGILPIRMMIGGILNGMRIPQTPHEHPEGLRKVRAMAEAPSNVSKIPTSVIHARWERWCVRHALCKRLLNLRDIKVEQQKYLHFAHPEDQYFTETDAGHNVHTEDPQTVIAAIEHMVQRISLK